MSGVDDEIARAMGVRPPLSERAPRRMPDGSFRLPICTPSEVDRLIAEGHIASRETSELRAHGFIPPPRVQGGLSGFELEQLERGFGYPARNCVGVPDDGSDFVLPAGLPPTLVNALRRRGQIAETPEKIAELRMHAATTTYADREVDEVLIFFLQSPDFSASELRRLRALGPTEARKEIERRVPSFVGVHAPPPLRGLLPVNPDERAIRELVKPYRALPAAIFRRLLALPLNEVRSWIASCGDFLDRYLRIASPYTMAVRTSGWR